MCSSCYNSPVTGENAQIQKDLAVAPEDPEFITGAVAGLSERQLFQVDLAFLGNKAGLFLSTHAL